MIFPYIYYEQILTKSLNKWDLQDNQCDHIYIYINLVCLCIWMSSCVFIFSMNHTYELMAVKVLLNLKSTFNCSFWLTSRWRNISYEYCKCSLLVFIKTYHIGGKISLSKDWILCCFTSSVSILLFALVYFMRKEISICIKVVKTQWKIVEDM